MRTRLPAAANLTTGVGVNLGIEYEDVDVLAAGNHVVQTAEADVIAGAVTTDDPLRTLNQVLTQLANLHVGRIVAVLDSLEDLVAQLAGLVTIVEVLDPLLVESLHVVSNGSVVESLLDEASNRELAQAGP